jgi:hypothetical protein
MRFSYVSIRDMESNNGMEKRRARKAEDMALSG